MGLHTMVTALASLLLCGVLVVRPAQAAAPGDGPARHHLCKPCMMPLLPITLPRYGMVLHDGSILSTGSLWYVVDLERGEVSRIAARDDRAPHKTDIVEHTTRPIPPDDLAALKQIASRIWASADWLPSLMATDVAWDLWQLDGGDVRRDYGPGMPGGLAKEAQQIIVRLVAAPASALPGSELG